MSGLDEIFGRFKALARGPEPDSLPPTANWVRHAEAELGHKLPPSYIRFLRECHGRALGLLTTYSVTDPARGSAFGIVAANKCEQHEASNPIPPFCVAFCNNGCGDQLCFDTRHRDGEGECRVVFWDHEEDNDVDDLLRWSSFRAWLLEEVENAELEQEPS